MRLTTKSFNLYVGSLPLIIRIVGLMDWWLFILYTNYTTLKDPYQDIEEVLSVRKS